MERMFAQVIMNPSRQRIMQYLIKSKSATVNDIAVELSDIPRSSLYRHINMLVDSGLLEVVEEKAVRGTLQKTYAIKLPIADSQSNADISSLIQNSLMSIMSSFADYFSRENISPQKDMLSVASSAFVLSDAEFAEMLTKIGQVLGEYMSYGAAEGRKTRSITFISAPVEDRED